MRPNRIVVDALLLNQNLSFFERVKDFSIEKLIPESDAETFTIAVFPG